MSDGPHRSLSMSLSWKRFAMRADNEAYPPEKVLEALQEALEQDYRAVPPNAMNLVRRVLDHGQRSLFGDNLAEGLEDLRTEQAGYPLLSTLLDYAIQVGARGLGGSDALTDAVRNTLIDRAARGARQVEEHYFRNSPQGRATHVRERIEACMTRLHMPALSARLLHMDRRHEPRKPPKQTGLDDGVPL